MSIPSYLNDRARATAFPCYVRSLLKQYNASSQCSTWANLIKDARLPNGGSNCRHFAGFAGIGSIAGNMQKTAARIRMDTSYSKMRAFLAILLVAIIFENAVVAETDNKPTASNINRKSPMNTKTQPEQENKRYFKRATAWHATSVSVLNVDKGEMEAFPAFTSTWGEGRREGVAAGRNCSSDDTYS
ncbi:MAG: hypothetical protein LBD14_06100 [Puniceicoccales bacterium]|nr:hypothetical protein [Puniceicoccales bacterium]